jgi:hypothetical protein
MLLMCVPVKRNDFGLLGKPANQSGGVSLARQIKKSRFHDIKNSAATPHVPQQTQATVRHPDSLGKASPRPSLHLFGAPSTEEPKNRYRPVLGKGIPATMSQELRKDF